MVCAGVCIACCRRACVRRDVLPTGPAEVAEMLRGIGEMLSVALLQLADIADPLAAPGACLLFLLLFFCEVLTSGSQQVDDPVTQPLVHDLRRAQHNLRG